MAKRLDNKNTRKKLNSLTPQYEDDQTLVMLPKDQIKGIRRLQAVLKTPGPDQQQHILEILKGNPPIMKAVIKHRQASRGIKKNHSQSYSKQLQHRKFQPLHAAVTTLSQNIPPVQYQNGLSEVQSQQLADEYRVGLEQLMAALKSPAPDRDVQEQTILGILKQHPRLMEAFINYRARQIEGLPGLSQVGACGGFAEAASIPGVSEPQMPMIPWDHILSALGNMNLEK